MTTSKKASRERASDRLVAIFEQQILDGVLKEGQPLPPEREIVDVYGVSRTVVREAVLALSNKGLIRATPGFRPVVVNPGFDVAIDLAGSIVQKLLRQPGGVRNLFDMRIMMEVALVREGALHANRTDIAALEAALSDNEAAIPDSEAFYRTDIAFHGVLYRIPGNPVLPAVHGAYSNWLAPHWSAMPRKPDRNRRNFEAHTKIYDAVLHRDPDKAEDMLRAHLDQAWRQVSSTFDDL